MDFVYVIFAKIIPEGWVHKIEKEKTGEIIVWYNGGTKHPTWPSMIEGIDKKVNDMMMTSGI